MRTIEGGCHCGNIRFTFHRPETDGPIPVRACGCAFCRKHGGAYTSHTDGRIEVRIGDAGRVEHYRFGTRTADFLICRTCGVTPVVTSEIEGNLYAVVSVNAFEGVDPSELDRSVCDFDAENTTDRLSRRQRSWIPKVTIETAPG